MPPSRCGGKGTDHAPIPPWPRLTGAEPRGHAARKFRFPDFTTSANNRAAHWARTGAPGAVCGRVSEWFKEPVLKTGEGASSPWVRIPPLPARDLSCNPHETAILGNRPGWLSLKSSHRMARLGLGRPFHHCYIRPRQMHCQTLRRRRCRGYAGDEPGRGKATASGSISPSTSPRSLIQSPGRPRAMEAPALSAEGAGVLCAASPFCVCPCLAP